MLNHLLEASVAHLARHSEGHTHLQGITLASYAAKHYQTRQPKSDLQAVLECTISIHSEEYLRSNDLRELYAFCQESSNPIVCHRIRSLGFSLSAARRGYYSTQLNNANAVSSLAFPLCYGYDRRIAVRFVSSTYDISIITDEYWGIPCMVVDNVTGDFFASTTSTIGSAQYGLYAASFAYYLGAFGDAFASVNLKEQAKPRKLSILTGGNNNIAHFFWNYQGGLDVYSSLEARFPCSDLIVISDAFRLESTMISAVEAEASIFLRHSLPWHEKVKALSRVHEKGCFVRLSGFGVFKNRHSQFMTYPNHTWLADGAECTSATAVIVITIRSSNRSLVDQQQVIFRLLATIAASQDLKISVILDGPCLQSDPSIQPDSFPEFLVINQLMSQLLSIGIPCTTNLGMTLEHQIAVCRSASAIITYFSGGNAKFTGIAQCPILFMAPRCDIVRHHTKHYREVPKKFQNALLEKYFSNSYFFLDPSYLAYCSLLYPYLAIPPDMLSSVSPELGMKSDFTCNPDFLKDILIRSLAFSRELRLSSTTPTPRKAPD